MKKIILAFAALAIAAGMSAQDLATATSTYNSGAEALTMGNKTDALEYFQKALAIAQGLGDEGADVVANCKNAIPSVILSIGKELYNNKDFEGALAKMKEASDKASEYGIEDIKAEVAELIPQVNLTKAMEGANSAFKAKDLAGALAGYKEVMALDSTNAVAALRLGQLLSGSNLEEAEKRDHRRSCQRTGGERHPAPRNSISQEGRKPAQGRQVRRCGKPCREGQ